MSIYFDCIHSILKNHQDVEKPYKYFSRDNLTIYYEYHIYGNTITFTVKNISKNDDIECKKYCHIIEDSDFNTVLKENLNKLKNILENYNDCIIQNAIDGCKFEKEECFKTH